MLQALLADRFKLAIHRENKEQAVYALVVAKGGSKLKESVPEPDAPAGADVSKDDAKKGMVIGTANGSQARVTYDTRGAVVRGGLGGGTTRMTPGPDGSMHMEASKMNLGALADALSRFVDRPVVDMTELKGDYQIALDISMADIMKAARSIGAAVPGALPGGASPADTASDPSSSSIFATVQQLGLKLEPRKAPIETIVIDRLEKTPTEN